MANFIKGEFGIKTKEAKGEVVKEEPVKIIEVKDTVLKEGMAEVIKQLSNKPDSIEQKANEVYEKINGTKRIRRRKKE